MDLARQSDKFAFQKMSAMSASQLFLEKALDIRISTKQYSINKQIQFVTLLKSYVYWVLTGNAKLNP